MSPEEWEKYQATPDDSETRIYASELQEGGDRVLVEGYNIDRGDLTVHLYGDKIVVYREKYDPEYRTDFEEEESFPAISLRPGKRAFPEKTDLAFANLMRSKGEPLTFTRYERD